MGLRPKATEVFDASSALHPLYRGIIGELVTEAERLNLFHVLHVKREDIVSKDRVICNCPKEEGASLANAYFRLSLGTLGRRREGRERKDDPETDALLRRVMATRLSVASCLPVRSEEEARKSVDNRVGLLEEIERFCKEQNIPSFAPNLFVARGLSALLANNDDYDPDNYPNTYGLYQNLVHLFADQEHHLSEMLETLERKGKHRTAVDLWEFAKAHCPSVPVPKPRPDEMHIINLFSQGRYQEVMDIALCMSAKEIQDYPLVAEKYVRSLVALELHDDAILFLRNCPAHTLNDQAFTDAVRSVKPSLVAHMKAQNRFSEASDFSRMVEKKTGVYRC